MSLYFPDHKVQWGLTVGSQTKTDIEEAQGREQRRRRYAPGIARRTMTGDLEFLGYTDRMALRDFILSLDGPYTPFYIYMWDPQLWSPYTVAVANGTDTQFDLPFKDIQQLVVRDNGVVVPECSTVPGTTPSYTLITVVYPAPQLFMYGTGSCSGPTLTPPTAGHTIAAYLIGRERVAVRLADDKQQEKFVQSSQVLAVRTINVIEVLGETL